LLFKLNTFAIDGLENPVKEAAEIKFEEEDKTNFKELQLQDLTLAKCWASVGESNFKFIIDGKCELLFRKKKVCGVEVKQLVVPAGKILIIRAGSCCNVCISPRN
jgi:hypothetical protein